VSVFFYLHFADEDGIAVAWAPDDHELDNRLASGGWIDDWKPLKFQLDKGVVVDYLPNSFAYRLCSDRLRQVLDGARGSVDTVQWLPAIVTDEQGKEHSYAILHFPEVPNVLSMTKSVLTGPMIVKAFLDKRLVEGHRIFSFPQETVRVVIAGEVKANIESSHCTGMKFSRVPVA